MNIYRIDNPRRGIRPRFDYFDAMVVVAKTPKRAKQLAFDFAGGDNGNWTKKPSLAKSKRVGIALPGARESVILASYNAG